MLQFVFNLFPIKSFVRECEETKAADNILLVLFQWEEWCKQVTFDLLSTHQTFNSTHSCFIIE